MCLVMLTDIAVTLKILDLVREALRTAAAVSKR